MVKPYKILLMLLLVNALFLSFILLFPKGELKISDNFRLRFLSLEELLHPKTASRVDINKIVSNVSDSLLSKQPSQQQNVTDTLVVRDDPRQLAKITYKVQFPDDKKDALDALFVSLDSIETFKKLVRIMHYGDSQIEGDRISSTFREMLQIKFGGCGTGIIPVDEPNALRHTIQITQSDNWIKYAVYGGLYKNFGSHKYGILGSAFRYYSTTDSTKPAGQLKAWLNFKKLFTAYPHAKKYETFNILYGKVQAPVNIALHFDAKQENITLQNSSSFVVKSLDLTRSPSSIEMDFFSDYCPDIYGVSLDGKQGVAVDNVPMRGSSGTDFMRLNMKYLSLQMQTMGTRMLILQYGVNVVPYVIDNYDFYEKQFYKQLKSFKENNPGISIMVIGVSDMSQKQGNNYVSYPNIERIRDAQKRAAFRAGCAYWDLYEAMGGRNSMASWVEAKPDALAEKDYTHFNARGARIIGEMIYNALMNEYYEYKNKKKSI